MQLFAKKPDTVIPPHSATDPLKQNTGSRQPEAGPAAANDHQAAQTPPPAQQRNRAAAITIISEDIKIEGNITAEREVRLEGQVEGDLSGNVVVVGEAGSVNGSISGEEVAVHGRVSGSIQGRNVMLYKTAHVEGDIHHQGIGIEMGTHYDGRLRWVEAAEQQHASPHTPPPQPPQRNVIEPAPYRGPPPTNGAVGNGIPSDAPVSIAYDAHAPEVQD